jgi:putative DNA primase/helicase
MEKNTQTNKQQVAEQVAAERQRLKPEEKKMAEIEKQVQERVEAEKAGQDPMDSVSWEQKITPKFIRDCLFAGDLGNGILYATRHRGQFIYCTSMDQWLVWEDHCWAIDDINKALAAVENVVALYYSEIKRVEQQILDAGGERAGDLTAGSDKPEVSEADTVESESKKGAPVASGDEADIKSLLKYRKKLWERITSLRSNNGRRNCLFAAYTCSEPLAIHGRELDQMAWWLPVKNGMVDLKTGKLHPGRPEYYMLRRCPTEYHGIFKPRIAWIKALMEIFDGNETVVQYMQRLIGMSLVAAVYEHAFPVLTGPNGRNGKGTFLETICEILGPLAGPIRAEMLMDSFNVQSSSGPTPDIMSLRGLRLAWASETKEGAKISAAKVKWLTGGDKLTGRNPHDKYETQFSPTHTLFLISNFKPAAEANDKAFWERMQNIPFTISFLKNREPKEPNERKADLYLKEKLMAEASGILGWMVEGCLMWQTQGLDPPIVVRQETQDYMDEEDNLGAFMDNCLEIRDHLEIGATALYEAFELWWTKYVGRWPWKQKKFGKHMRERFHCKKTSGVYRYFGVDLNDEWHAIMAEKRAR